MSIKTYLKHIADLLDMKRRKCEHKKKCLRTAIKVLDEKESELDHKLDKEKHGKARKKLEDRIKVLHVQKRKGEKFLKDLENN